MTAAANALPGQDDPVNFAFRRIVDLAEDVSGDDKLRRRVVTEIAALDSGQREDLIGMLAGAVGRLLARQRPRRAGRRDHQVVDRTVGVIVAAASSCTDLGSFHRQFQLATDQLTRQQLARVSAALALELARQQRSRK